MNRCGECCNCKQLKKVQHSVLRVALSPGQRVDQGCVDLWNGELDRLPCVSNIGSLTEKELDLYLAPLMWRRADSDDSWDGTDEGVNAQHGLTRLYGLPFVSKKAPKDWAWQLVGDIGLGFSGTSQDRVVLALDARGWLLLS